MDPNVNLASIRELVQTILGQYYDANSNGIDQDDAAALAEDFDNLDQWLSKGGFLPLDWQQRRPYWRIITDTCEVDDACEIDDCTNDAQPCQCGTAHCDEHPHID